MFWKTKYKTTKNCRLPGIEETIKAANKVQIHRERILIKCFQEKAGFEGRDNITMFIDTNLDQL
jgi:hypothetical protein